MTPNEPRPRDPQAKVYEYCATTVAGLEEVAAQDLRQQLQELRQVRVEQGGRHGRIYFHYERSPRKLLELRSVDNVFAVLAEVRGITTGPPGLRHLAAALSRVEVAPALALYTRLHPGLRGMGCRLVCTVSGEHRFTAGDVHQAVRDAVGGQCPLESQPAPESCTLQLQVLGKKAVWGLQLAPRRLRDRAYRQADLAGGLEATVAYCMALLADTDRTGICLDPLCGSGTTLIEAGLGFGPRLLLGGDLVRLSLAAARRNAGAAGLAPGLVAWDARGLPLPAAAVDAVLCNLPYGKKVAATGDERRLLGELARVLRPGRKAVLLAVAESGVDALLEEPNAGFTLHRRLPLHLRGVDPVLYVLARRAT